MWNLREEVYTRLGFIPHFPNGNGNKWLCHWAGVGKKKNGCGIKFVAPGGELVNTTLEWTSLHFQLVDAAFPSWFFLLLLFGPCEGNISMKEKRSRNVSKVSSSPPPKKLFNLPAHFPYSVTLLSVISSFPAVKAFPSPLLSLVGLLSSELAFLPFMSLPSSSSSSSSCLTGADTFCHPYQADQRTGIGGIGANSSGSTIWFSMILWFLKTRCHWSVSNLWLSPSLDECGFNWDFWRFFEGKWFGGKEREELVVEFSALFFASLGFLMNGLPGQNRVRKLSAWWREILEILAGLVCFAF